MLSGISLGPVDGILQVNGNIKLGEFGKDKYYYANLQRGVQNGDLTEFHKGAK